MYTVLITFCMILKSIPSFFTYRIHYTFSNHSEWFYIAKFVYRHLSEYFTDLY